MRRFFYLNLTPNLSATSTSSAGESASAIGLTEKRTYQPNWTKRREKYNFPMTALVAAEDLRHDITKKWQVRPQLNCLKRFFNWTVSKPYGTRKQRYAAQCKNDRVFNISWWDVYFCWHSAPLGVQYSCQWEGQLKQSCWLAGWMCTECHAKEPIQEVEISTSLCW